MMRKFFVMVALVALGGTTLGVGVAGADSNAVSCQLSGRVKFYRQITSTPGTITFNLRLGSNSCTGSAGLGRVKIYVRSVMIPATDCSSTSLGALTAQAKWHTRGESLHDSKITFLTSSVGPGFSTLILGVTKATDSTIGDWNSHRGPGAFSGETAQLAMSLTPYPRHACPDDLRKATVSGTLTI